ncbi:MAG: hypothetical protein E6L02_00020 [Thaumarchaeota archaeon]|nr:MAG: hypothetical protein E6L02_00020 [Nitrososphaerota archaeon]
MELREAPFNTEIIVFRKNIPNKPIMAIPISALAELGNGKMSIAYSDVKITLLQEQMLIRDKKTIQALAVIPKAVLNSTRYIYELGDAELQSSFLRVLSGALRELSLETLGTDEDYQVEVERILQENQKKMEDQKKKKETF